MSVILDALRRARGLAPGRPAAAAPSGIPSALKARPLARRKVKQTGTRWSLIAGVVVLAGVLYAGVQFGLPLLRRAMPAGSVALAPRRVPPAVSEVERPAAAPQTPATDQAAAPVQEPVSVLEQVLVKAKESVPIAPRAMPGTPPATASRGGPSGPPSSGRPASRAASRRPLPTAPSSTVTSAASTATPPSPAVDHFDLAVRYQSLGNFAQALVHYTALLEADEFNVEARNNLGLLYHERGLTSEAIEQFRRAISIDPRYVRARSNLAVVLTSAGRLAEARAELRAALAIEPRNVDLLVNMALVEKADRQPEQAREILIRALGYQPGHAAAHYNLGVLYDEAGEVARALGHYNDFLQNAGPEHGTRLSDVRRRVDVIQAKVTMPGPAQNR